MMKISYSILISLLVSGFILSSVLCLGILPASYVKYFITSGIGIFIAASLFSYARITNSTHLLPRGRCGVLKRHVGKLLLLALECAAIGGLVKLLVKGKQLLPTLSDCIYNAKSALGSIGLHGFKALYVAKAAVCVFLGGILTGLLSALIYALYKFIKKDMYMHHFSFSSSSGPVPSHLNVSSVKNSSTTISTPNRSAFGGSAPNLFKATQPIVIKNGEGSVVSGGNTDVVQNSLSVGIKVAE